MEYSLSHTERLNHALTHCLVRSWGDICFAAEHPAQNHVLQHSRPEHILVILTSCNWRHERTISLWVAVDSVRGSVLSLLDTREGALDEDIVHGLLNYIDRVTRFECGVIRDVAVASNIATLRQGTRLRGTAPRGSNGSLGRWKRRNRPSKDGCEPPA